MPSFTMKKTSSTDSSGDNNLLRVCHKSTMISKNSNSYARISHTSDTSIQAYQNVSPGIEVSVQDIGCDEAFDHDKFQDSVVRDFQLLRHEFPFTDPTTKERKEFTPAHCQSNFETIFSPVLECSEVHIVSNEFNDAVSKDGLDMAQFRAGDSDDSSRTSSDDQTHNISDFYISDIIVPEVLLDRDAMYSDICGICPDYQFAESSMWFDMAEHYMLLPFLKDTAENSNTQDAKSSEESLTESDASCLYLTIDQCKPCDQDSDANHNADLDQAEWFDPHNIIKDLPDLSDASTFRPLLLPNEICKKKSITLVLDLDETLVHSTLEHCDNADFTFPVFFSMKEHTVYVRQRPFLRTFMERVAELFDIVVFTASQSLYAEQLLDILDPDGRFICRRFFRESCIFSDDSYTKDLTILGVELAKVAIIDNSPQVFQLQVNNGIPIKSWFDDPSDRALVSLLPFLETLAEADDVRPIIARKFGNKE